jgi:hypothetical protein
MRGPLSGKTLRLMPWTNDLRADVEEQLAWEPDIDANAIAVMVVDGHVTLLDEIEIMCPPRRLVDHA